MSEYEIRLHKSDGAPSIVMFTLGYSDRDAKAQARLMLRGDMVQAHVWRGDLLVESMTALPPGLSKHIHELREVSREMRRAASGASLPGYAEKMNRAADELDALVASGGALRSSL